MCVSVSTGICWAQSVDLRISMDLPAQSVDPYSVHKSMDYAEICGSRRVQSTDLPVIYPDLTLISLL